MGRKTKSHLGHWNPASVAHGGPEFKSRPRFRDQYRFQTDDTPGGAGQSQWRAAPEGGCHSSVLERVLRGGKKKRSATLVPLTKNYRTPKELFFNGWESVDTAERTCVPEPEMVA